ncbi:CHAT domain-containing protein [Larkinella terrae]|uniref:CHAT domain-containing protein n=1 Tax=Larkinella terrae TaxID=2025311 RepID=A0A7K0EM45_9BACT|nr:CHAT domain-containing tetratricopeptide repeat protein [Larkinella terrae]MRS62611.1 CHAT domain-containing protein [Larkinella terrae]
MKPTQVVYFSVQPAHFARVSWTIWVGISFWLVITGGFTHAQCPPQTAIRQAYDSLMQLPAGQQTPAFRQLLGVCNRCRSNQDSTYGQIWHRLGALAYFQKDYKTALVCTKRAIAINAQKRPDASRSFLAKSYFNLAKIYLELQDERQARLVFQQFVALGSQFPERFELVAMGYWNLSTLFFKEADYQKAIRQADLGALFSERINRPDLLAANLTEKANCLKEMDDYEQALSIMQRVIQIFEKESKPTVERANAFGAKASVLVRLGWFQDALAAYDQAYRIHQQLENSSYGLSQITSNIGFVYDNYLHQYNKALVQYRKALATIGDDKYGRVRILSNIGEVYWRKKQFRNALNYFQVALDSLHFDDRQKPQALTEAIRSTPYKEYLLSIIQDKAYTWLDYARNQPNPSRNFLQTALKSFQTADQIIDVMRFEQVGQQSKLYWRETTHSLYERAIETAFLLQDSEQAFHFFEKSRAVLLSDKLNELGARQQLPAQLAQQEQEFHRRINNLQNELSELKTGQRAFDSTRTALLTEQEKLDSFLKKLERENPTYYRYKFDNTVPSLAHLQNWLKDRQSTLVSYFVGDSALYMLSVEPAATRLIKQPILDYQKAVQAFLQLCTTSQQNRQFGHFVALSNLIYNQLIKPLSLSTERVIISPDYHFIPFETLSRTASQPDFLINHHAFSYGYSATVLLKETAVSSSGSSEFLGMAPVHFNPQLQQASLLGSDQVVSKIGKLFSQPTVLTDRAATRRAFQTQAPNFQVVQLFTHAEADSIGREPRLYFADSTLRLSELNDDSPYQTQLIVLSACKTSIGVNQQGEGVFSLARGFATLGIPSVLTTLWSVEDQATYELTERFYEHLSRGTPKDLALRHAKLDWLKTASRANQLPYRWAGMILVGNAEPLSSSTKMQWWLGGGLVVILAIIGGRQLRRRNKSAKVGH